jgi:predicted TIM-barrel fold metal-dependent hydrolase
LIKLPSGGDAIIIENRGPMAPGLAIAGKPFQEHTPETAIFEGSAGTGPAEQRVAEQDEDGIDAEVIYTHPSYPTHWRGIRDDEPYRAMIHAYNEFLAEDYAGGAPDRLFPMGVIPDTGVDEAIAEMEHCARLGLKGVNLHRFPSGKGFPTSEDDRFWQAAISMRMPLSSHTVGGSTRFTREGPVFQYRKTPKDGSASNGRDPVNLMVRFASENAITPLQMAFAGVWDRFPNLRIYWAETQIGWLPYCLSQIDDNYERNRHWAARLWDLEPLERKPSDYLRDQTWGFMYDPLGVELRDKIGVERLIWGSDFPHAAGNWPHSRRIIDESFGDATPQERHAMLVGNIASFLGLQAAEPAAGTAAVAAGGA